MLNTAHFLLGNRMEDTPQLVLSDCFELGKALRSGDADTFCKVYDSLLAGDPGENYHFKV